MRPVGSRSMSEPTRAPVAGDQDEVADRRHWLRQDMNVWFFLFFGFGTIGFWIGAEL